MQCLCRGIADSKSGIKVIGIGGVHGPALENDLGKKDSSGEDVSGACWHRRSEDEGSETEEKNAESGMEDGRGGVLGRTDGEEKAENC